jgi:hypothetical protein
VVLDPATLREWWHEPPEVFAQRLTIENTTNDLQAMSPLFVEQVAYVEALARSKRIIAIKPRQVGFTTAATLFFFAKTYRAANRRLVLQTVHDDDARDRVRRMVEVAYEELPRELRFGVKHNSRRTEFPHNRAGFRRVIAGRKGQGRAFTFTDYHATEMAFYPARSSALAGADQDADADLFSSIQAAMHDPTGHIVVESTGNGPRGLFHRLVQQAANGKHPGMEFVFLPWTVSPRYRFDGLDGRPSLAEVYPTGFEPNDAEVELARKYGLTSEQLGWRRWKLEVQGYTEVRFRREYPLTWMDPFILDESAWFSQVRLDEMAALTRLDRLFTQDFGVQVFVPPEPGRRYFIGADTSGGVRRDEFVLHVLRDDLEHCATFASSELKEDGQALMLARVASMFNDALVLVEANNFGAAVIELCRGLGVNLWRTRDGDFWYSTGRGSGDRKRQMMLHARKMIDGEMTRAKDPQTILQLQVVVEKPNGRIEARGDGHDDRAIAFCLALLCAERYTTPTEYDPEEARRRLRDELMASIRKKWGT